MTHAIVLIQAEMIPASESKMNAAGPVVPPIVILNPGVELNTMPVGAPCGIETTSDWITGMLP